MNQLTNFVLTLIGRTCLAEHVCSLKFILSTSIIVFKITTKTEKFNKKKIISIAITLSCSV